MKILQLSPRLPYPLTDGGAIGIYNITKSVSALGHDITFVSYPLEDSQETRRAVEDMSRFCKVRLVKRPLPARWRVLLRTMFRGAYPIERRMMPEMYELIRSLISAADFDVVHVDHSHMGTYGRWIKREFGLPVVIREHNFEALIYERFVKVERNPLFRAVAATHGRRLLVEETRTLNELDAIAAISEEDARIIRRVAPATPLEIIPAGVDLDYFHPSPKHPASDHILWIGSLAWDPNFDAVRYFIEEIFPQVLRFRPGSTFHLVGSHLERLGKLAGLEGIVLHGKVADVRDYLTNAAVLVVPLRVGGGMRLKLLEFFASGKAVVSTTIGAEGNLAVDGKEVLLRDDPQSFAEGVVRLLSDIDERNVLGRNARKLVEDHYSWTQIGHQFEDLYQRVHRQRAASVSGL